MRASFTTCIELLCFLFFQQFHAEFLPSSPDGTDSIFGDSPNNPLEAIASVSDGYRSPNSNNLDDPIFIQSFSSTNADDYLASVNPVESDHLDVSMDQCSSADDSWLSGKLRARGAFCTNGDSSPVNQNPSLAGLDASERVTDPENRRQCDAKLETLCCEGPLFPPYVFDCERYDPDARGCWGPWVYYCCSALLPLSGLGFETLGQVADPSVGIGLNCERLFPEHGKF